MFLFFAALAQAVTGVPPQEVDLTIRPRCAKQTASESDILVCARPSGDQSPYRLDPDVMLAAHAAAADKASGKARVPTAQKSCSATPTGCGRDLAGLDLLNVAVVVGTMAVKAAKGEDWTKAFKVGGPDEYQFYVQAKRRREAHDAERAAAAANHAYPEK